MKIKAMMLTAFLTAAMMVAAGLALATVSAAQQNKDDNPKGTVSKTPHRNTDAIVLQCKNSGTNQDVVKDPNVFNTTGQTLPVGTKISWNSSDGDKGTKVLDKPLAPGASVEVLGQAGNYYTCNAWISISPVVPIKRK